MAQTYYAPQTKGVAAGVFALCAITLLLLSFGPVSNHAFSAACSILVFIAILALFWRRGEPLIFIYVFLFQWLEASVYIFHGEDSQIDEPRQAATAMLLAGILVQAFAANLAAGPFRNAFRGLAEMQLARIPQRDWLVLYLKALALSTIAQLLASLVPPLSQPLLVLPFLKWAAFVIFTFASFQQPDASRKLWLLVFLLELLFSIGDYFSSFKFVFVFTFIGISPSLVRFSSVAKMGLGIVVALALLFGSVWSSIKGEYRSFVSGGEQAQIVTVDFPERVAKIAELVSELEWPDVLNGFDLLLKRIEYVEYFGDVTVQVPGYLPHTLGALWFDAITRPLMPRLFFPDKAVIDESELTRAYTGREVAGFAEGTQVSIGYIAESYIDFGKFGMIVLLFVWGLTQGWVYRWLMLGQRSRGLMGTGLATALFILTCSSVGNSSAKLVGGFAVGVLVFWVFLRFIVPTRSLGIRRLFPELARGGDLVGQVN